MAKRDVVNYYIAVQNQYLEMLEDAKDIEEAFKGGHFTQERYEQALSYVEVVKSNYEILSYIILLLNEPSRKRKKAKFGKQNKKVYDYLGKSSDCYIKSENEDALKKLKELMKEKYNG